MFRKNLSLLVICAVFGTVFVGCDVSTPANDSSKNAQLSIKVLNSGSEIDFTWVRTGKVVYYSHTDLVVVNSNGISKISQTNSDEKISITCEKGVYDGNKGQSFSCTASNTPGQSYSFYLPDGETSIIQERGYYENTDHGSLQVGSLTPDNSGSYLVNK